MKLDQNTIDAIAKAGISFVARIPCPGGAESIWLKPDNIGVFIDDPELAAANYYKASRQEYRDWIATEGTPRCGATTKSGKRCRNIVSGGIQQPFPRWLQLDGGFCAVHGGETSEESRRR